MKRGWFTYTDLCVLLEQSNWKEALTGIYQHFTKVRCGILIFNFKNICKDTLIRCSPPSCRLPVCWVSFTWLALPVSSRLPRWSTCSLVSPAPVVLSWARWSPHPSRPIEHFFQISHQTLQTWPLTSAAAPWPTTALIRTLLWQSTRVPHPSMGTACCVCGALSSLLWPILTPRRTTNNKTV